MKNVSGKSTLFLLKVPHNSPILVISCSCNYTLVPAVHPRVSELVAWTSHQIRVATLERSRESIEEILKSQ